MKIILSLEQSKQMRSSAINLPINFALFEYLSDSANL